MAKLSPYEKKLYTEFGLTIPQAKSIAKATKRQPILRISAATTQVRQGPMKESEGKRIKSLSSKAERSRTVSRLNKKKK
jgi:hypothetical protein